MAQSELSAKRTQHLIIVLAKIWGKIKNYNETTGFRNPSFIFFLHSELRKGTAVWFPLPKARGWGEFLLTIIDLALHTGNAALAVMGAKPALAAFL